MSLVVRSFSQMRKAARAKIQELRVVGELAPAIQRAFEFPQPIEPEDDLRGLLHSYQVVSVQNGDPLAGLTLCHKMKSA